MSSVVEGSGQVVSFSKFLQAHLFVSLLFVSSWGMMCSSTPVHGDMLTNS